MCRRLNELLQSLLNEVQWLPGLVSRFTIGFIFIQSGWGKLHHLDKVVEFFTSLGIPAPHLQAPFVAAVEFGCGLLVLLGLFTRLAAIPLIGTMAVAIITAKKDDIAELSALLGLSEYLFIVVLLWLVVKGAGAVSVDFYLSKICCKKEK